MMGINRYIKELGLGAGKYIKNKYETMLENAINYGKLYPSHPAITELINEIGERPEMFRMDKNYFPHPNILGMTDLVKVWVKNGLDYANEAITTIHELVHIRRGKTGEPQDEDLVHGEALYRFARA